MFHKIEQHAYPFSSPKNGILDPFKQLKRFITNHLKAISIVLIGLTGVLLELGYQFYHFNEIWLLFPNIWAIVAVISLVLGLELAVIGVVRRRSEITKQ